MSCIDIEWFVAGSKCGYFCQNTKHANTFFVQASNTSFCGRTKNSFSLFSPLAVHIEMCCFFKCAYRNVLCTVQWIDVIWNSMLSEYFLCCFSIFFPAVLARFFPEEKIETKPDRECDHVDMFLWWIWNFPFVAPWCSRGWSFLFELACVHFGVSPFQRNFSSRNRLDRCDLKDLFHVHTILHEKNKFTNSDEIKKWT